MREYAYLTIWNCTSDVDKRLYPKLSDQKAILIIAHGSRVSSSNLEIKALSEYLHKETKGVIIAHSFLELAEPSIEKSVKDLVMNSVKFIRLYPYFLTSGKHVLEDIPMAVEALREKYPKVHFETLSYLGKSSLGGNSSFLQYLKKEFETL